MLVLPTVDPLQHDYLLLAETKLGYVLEQLCLTNGAAEFLLLFGSI